MMLRTAVAATCVLIGLSAVCRAEVKLVRKYNEGSSDRVETTSRIEQKLTIAGMETDTAADTRSTVTTTVGKRDAAGMLKMDTQVESLQINMTVQGQNYSFDSSSPDVKGTSQLEVLRDVHKALARRKVSTILDKENRVYAIESDPNLLNSLPPEVQAMAKSQLDPEYLKKAANQEIEAITSEPVNKGDSWQRTEVANFGAGQLMTFQVQYTYEGTAERNGKTLDKITSKTMSVDFSLQDSPLPLQLKGSDLKVAESSGVIWFDREAGDVVENTNSMRIVGDITFAVNGMDLPSKLDLKMETSVQLKP